MNCPICKHKTMVTNSEIVKSKVRRRRECVDCLTRFRTYEEIDIKSLPYYLRTQIRRNNQIV